MPQILSSLTKNKQSQITEWFKTITANKPTVIYSSVDIRNSGYKVAPVDTNLFPAGFNNLSDSQKEQATEQFKRFLDSHQTIALIPENHDRNFYYWQNLLTLKQIIEDAGKQVTITTYDDSFAGTKEFADGTTTEVKLATVKDNKLVIDSVTPDIIISNKDFSASSPALLQSIQQPIYPPISHGWYRRRKDKHFMAYEKVANKFAKDFAIDPWLIDSYFRRCGKIDFKTRKGLDCIANNVEKLIYKITEKYKQYDIKDTPYVYIKANTGTYGMGIMVVENGEQVYEINKKTRNKMNTTKDGNITTEVVIQEGIPTIDSINNNPAEPTLYQVNNQSIGGFWRSNTQANDRTNLNSTGMLFNGLEVNNEYWQQLSLIAQLATLSTTSEEFEVEDFMI